MSRSGIIHESLTNGSRSIPPRVGGGVGGRGEVALLHASHLTDGPVENARATANAATRHQAACSGFAEDGRWLR